MDEREPPLSSPLDITKGNQPMDGQTAIEEIKKLRSADGAEWIDNTHIATNRFWNGVVAKLSRDPKPCGDRNCSLAVFRLSEEIPGIDAFGGIFEVDDIGIWYYDGDENRNAPIWRQGVIPWRCVERLVLHQSS
jgi:hypothetical protein